VKAQHYVRMILDSLYSARPDGLPGNEDCGQMSAWYVMSALGLYQVCPGDPVYTIASPLFPRAIIHLENGKQFVVEAEGHSSGNVYIQSARLNGRSLEAPFISHEELSGGGKLQLTMGETEGEFGSGKYCPFSQATTESRDVPLPSIHAPSDRFTDSLVISLSSAEPAATIRYTLDGSDPSESSERIDAPFVIRETTTIRARTIAADGRASDIASARFQRYAPPGSLILLTPYSPQYPGGGDHALIDGRRGGNNWRLGAWQGYEGNDLVAVVDLGTVRTIKEVTLGCLQDEASWIFFPVEVEFSLSGDGEHFDTPVRVANPVPPDEPGSIVREFPAALGNVEARYIRVEARSLRTCPEWHKGKGEKAWLFVDEIRVEMGDEKREDRR